MKYRTQLIDIDATNGLMGHRIFDTEQEAKKWGEDKKEEYAVLSRISGLPMIKIVYEITVIADPALDVDDDFIAYEDELIASKHPAVYPPEKPRRIVCAAIRKDDIIIAGVRHFDPIMCKMQYLIIDDNKKWAHGFVDNRGLWHTRESAYLIALEAGQVADDGRTYRLLASEDLY